MGMDEPTLSPQAPTRRRRKPRAARSRKAAAALSVASMLSLGGVLAWHDGQVATTSQTAAVSASTKSSGTTSSNRSGESGESGESDDSSATRRHDDAEHFELVVPERDLAHLDERELTHGPDPLVRGPFERHRRLGADPRHHRVGTAARHQGARPPPGPGMAPQPPPLPRRTHRRLRGRARGCDPARHLHELRHHQRARAVHGFVAPRRRRLGHRRHVPAGGDRDHIAAAPPVVEAGLARRAPA